MHEKEGTLLVGTYRGLAISKDGGQEWELKTIADGMGSNRTHNVFIDGQGTYYGATLRGLFSCTIE